MDASTINLQQHVRQVYEQHIKPLPLDERLELLEFIAHDLGKQMKLFQEATNQHIDVSPEVILSALEPTDSLIQHMGRVNRKWQEIAGTASPSLMGEDAQAWVSRTRHESDATPQS